MVNEHRARLSPGLATGRSDGEDGGEGSYRMNDAFDETLTLPLCIGKGEATHALPETFPSVNERGFYARQLR